MDCYECLRTAEVELVGIREIYTHDDSPEVHVMKFNFFSEVIASDWILLEDSTEPQHWADFCEDMENSLCLSLRQVLCYEETRRALEEELCHLNLADSDRQNLIEYAWGEAYKLAWETVNSEPNSGHKILHLDFHVTMKHKYVFYERSLVIQLSIQESDDESFMVPAVDSSIESLKRKPIDPGNVETCSVCLEDISVEALSMPCSHIFHGSCIKKWLRNSHYCPLCRFEMPTS